MRVPLRRKNAHEPFRPTLVHICVDHDTFSMPHRRVTTQTYQEASIPRRPFQPQDHADQAAKSAKDTMHKGKEALEQSSDKVKREADVAAGDVKQTAKKVVLSSVPSTAFMLSAEWGSCPAGFKSGTGHCGDLKGQGRQGIRGYQKVCNGCIRECQEQGRECHKVMISSEIVSPGLLICCLHVLQDLSQSFWLQGNV